MKLLLASPFLGVFGFWIVCKDRNFIGLYNMLLMHENANSFLMVLNNGIIVNIAAPLTVAVSTDLLNFLKDLCSRN